MKKLNENYDNVIYYEGVIYFNPEEKGVGFQDIITDTRALANVVKVTQLLPLKKTVNNYKRTILEIGYLPDLEPGHNIEEFAKKVNNMKAVKLFKIVKQDGQPYNKPQSVKRQPSNQKQNVAESKNKIWDENIIGNNKKIRKFSKNLTESKLEWHRDKENRKLTILEGVGWKFQLDNKLPKTLKKGESIFIEANCWHRLIKGTTDLSVLIEFL
jgi:hypothetical protein